MGREEKLRRSGSIYALITAYSPSNIAVGHFPKNFNRTDEIRRIANFQKGTKQNPDALESRRNVEDVITMVVVSKTTGLLVFDGRLNRRFVLEIFELL